jgi:hypothetical protein
MNNFNYTGFTDQELLDMFRKMNNEGLGFDPDGTLGDHVAHTDELDVIDTGSSLMLVGNANGLWAVKVTK